MFVKPVKVLAVLAFGTLSLTACGGSDESANSGDGSTGDSGLPLITAGTLTVCSDIPYPPFEYEESGEYVGFDMDLIKAIGEGMDLQVEVKDQGFEALQSGALFAANQCDVAASAMTITDERQEQLAFSDSYYDSKQSLLVPEGSDITSIEDLADKTVGVQAGTTGEIYAREHVPDSAEIKSYPSDGELFPAAQARGVDAVLQDFPVNLLHTQDGKFTIVEEYDTDEKYGFAMKKEGSEALVDAVNEQLAALRDNGTYQELFDKYLTEK